MGENFNCCFAAEETTGKRVGVMQVDRGDMVPQESVLFHGFLMKRSLGRSTTAIHNWRNRYLVLSGPYTHGDSAHYCNEIRW